MTTRILGFTFRLGLALLFCAAVASAQDAQDAKDWYPLQRGDTWTYQKEALDGDMAHPNVERWTTEEKITSEVAVPEVAGTMITKTVKVLSDVLTSGFLPQNGSAKHELPESHALIRQNCVYLLDGLDARGAREVESAAGSDVSALDSDNHIRPAYRDELIRGNVPPDFCFPMAKGAKWGNVFSTSPADEFVWNVTNFNADPFGPPGGNTFHMWSNLGSGDLIDRWFEKGIGVVQEVEEHHGTYDEFRRLLLSTTIHGKTHSYQLAPARTIPLSKLDCDGPGWQHFVRADGTPFRDIADCVSYSSVSNSAR